MVSILLAVVTVSYLFIALTMLLPTPLKPMQSICLIVEIAACYILFSDLGQTSTYFVLFCSLSLIVLFSQNKPAGFFCALFGYIISVALNNTMLNILPLLFHTELTALTDMESILFNVCFCVVLVILLLLIRRFFLPRMSFVFEKEYRTFQICIIIEEVLCVSVYVFMFIYGEKVGYPPEVIATNSFLFLLLFLFSVVLMVLVILALHKVQENQLRIQQLETLESYTQDLERLHKIMRTMNHDYKNLFSTAYSFIDMGDLDGLKKFYDKSLNRLSEEFDVSNKEIGNLGNVYLPEIKGLLYSKALHALALNLNLKIRIDYEIRQVAMNTTDLVRILGIYLDNAIEAATETDEKEVIIYFSQVDDSTTWTIANSFSGDASVISRMNEYGFSTKGENRGIGLFTVSELLKEYPNVLSGTQILNSHFVQTLHNI